MNLEYGVLTIVKQTRLKRR